MCDPLATAQPLGPVHDMAASSPADAERFGNEGVDALGALPVGRELAMAPPPPPSPPAVRPAHGSRSASSQFGFAP